MHDKIYDRKFRRIHVFRFTFVFHIVDEKNVLKNNNNDN